MTRRRLTTLRPCITRFQNFSAKNHSFASSIMLNCTAELQNHCVPQQKSNCQLTGFWLGGATWCCKWRRKVLFKRQGGGDEV